MGIEGIKKEFSTNRPTWLWRGGLLGLLGVLSFLGSWVFAEVSAMPKTYATKEKVRQIEQDNDREHRQMLDKIDDGFRETQRIILDLHKK